jgi:hypothetical protein
MARSVSSLLAYARTPLTGIDKGKAEIRLDPKLSNLAQLRLKSPI